MTHLTDVLVYVDTVYNTSCESTEVLIKPFEEN